MALPLPCTIRWTSFSRRLEAPELLDEPGHDSRMLRGNLRDIRRVNRYFGGVGAVIRELTDLVEGTPRDKPLAVLDLGTGSGDIPLAVLAWARSAGRTVHICASDVSPEVLAIAKEEIPPDPAIALAQYDARAVPLPDRSVDIVLCSLTLHHFPPAQVVTVLQEMDRLAARGFIVNDLRRSAAGFALGWLASRALTRNPLTRHDAPLSVRRAYTIEEVERLLARAGVEGAMVRAVPWFRLVAVRGPAR